MEHEQNAEHFYNDDSSLSTMDRVRYLYIDHLKGARVLEEASNNTAIQSLRNLNNGNVQAKHDNDLFEQVFLSQGYAIRQRQKSTKMTDEQQNFFLQLFYHGQDTGKKVTIEKAYQDMRAALKPDKTKLFPTNQYLTKNQIRSLFGRLTKKETTERRKEWMNNDDNDDHNANDYFKIQQEEELEDMKNDEVDNALNSYSDNDYDSDQTE
jgi:hypothetical protein